jgi:hypothetical protein
MSADQPKRPRGRPPNSGAMCPLKLSIPKHNYDYLTYLVERKSRLGATVNEAAEHILIRELDSLFRSDYHAKEVPET